MRLDDGERFLLKEAVETAGDLLLGAAVMQRERRLEPALQVLRQHGADSASHAPERCAGQAASAASGKPEAYYFPPQYNQIDNNFPYTFMGLEPGTTKDDVRRCLENWNKGDNGILFLSRAFRLQPGTGWQIDPGILHAPGSLVTYEPQVNSDVFAMFQSEVEGRIIDWSLLTKDVPPEYHHDLDFLVEHARLGRERQPGVREEQPRVPATRANRLPKPRPKGIASSGSATARATTRRRS